MVLPTQRFRGEAYFRERRARVISAGPLGVSVSVRGSRPYSVSLDVEGDTLRCECDCPFFQDNQQPCKHVWAALLAAEHQGHLGGAKSLRRLEPVEQDESEDLLAGEEDAIEEDDLIPPASLAVPPGLPPTRSRRRHASWEDAIEMLQAARRLAARATDGFAPGRREILYLVDLSSMLEPRGLTVALLQRDRRRDGTWGRLKPLAIAHDQISVLPDLIDRRILALLKGASPTYVYGYPSRYERMAAAVEIAAPAADLLLRELCSTGRCLVRKDSGAEARPLTHDEGEPWRSRIDVEWDAEGRCYVVTGHLARASETMPLSRPDLLLSSGLCFAGDRVSRFEHGGAFPLIAQIRRLGRIEIPRAEGVRFVSEILATGRDLAAALPEELRFEEVRTTPRPAVRVLRPSSPWLRHRLQAIVTFDYDGLLIEAGAEPAALLDPDARRAMIRDPQAENAALAFLSSVGFRASGAHRPGEPVRLELASGRLPAAVPQLTRAGWRVEAEGRLYRTATDFRIEVSSGIDWFELRGGATYDGAEVPLPALLAALRKGEPTISLGDGSLGVLPQEWLERYAPVAGIGEGVGDHLRFTRAQAGFLDALIATAPEATCDDPFERVRRKLHEFDGVEPVEAPAGFQGTLRPYQKEGLGWLCFLREFGFGGCLADDMGLGKTIQILALLEARRASAGPGAGKVSLVVAPRSIVFNWLSEARRFTPRLRFLDHTGLVRARSQEELRDWDVVLTTYGTMRRDIAILKEIAFDTVLLDESQAIKNAGTQTAKAVRLLRGDQRLALSGTPIENHLGELWSLFEFLNPGMLGSSSAFQLGARAAEEPDGPARTILARALRPFFLRRTKKQVAPELPEKTEQTLTCELAGTQRKLYDELLEHYRASLRSRVERDGLAKSKIQVLEALLRLRQAACHPALLDPRRAREGSAKFDVLFSQLDEVLEEGHKALVFSQFTSLLALVRKRLDARGLTYAYLDGTMGARQRESAVRLFQEDPRCRLFLLSLKAGGYGLNLTEAEYVYLLDPWWNPAVEAQAIDRSHRIGQTRHVFAYRIVASGTIEEKILALQSSKRELADSILAADASLVRDLTREDLELLLS
jgi:hypothetical protein